MGWILNGITETLLSILTELCIDVMKWFSDLIASAIGTSPNAFTTMFPIISDISTALMAVGYALVVSFAILGLFRNFFSGLGFFGENPVKMAIRIVLAIVGVAAIKPILLVLFSGTSTGVSSGDGLFTSIFDAINSLEGAEAGYDLSQAFEFDGTAFITGGISSMAIGTICLVLIGTICINFIKLALEMFERYVLLCILIFFSPLASSAITLESTLRVFSAYLKMFFGQLIMMLMNLISIKLVVSGMKMVAASYTGSLIIPGVDASLTSIFGLMLIVALLKVLQRLDNYARDIGLTVGITGGKLTDELLAAGATVGHIGKTVLGKRSSGSKSGSGSGSGVAGASILSRAGFTGGILGMAVRYGGAAVAATAAATFGRRDIGSGLSNKNWGERWSDKFSQMSGVKNETKSSIIGGVLGYNPPRNSIPLHVSRLNQKLGNTDINGKAAPFGDFKNAVAGTGGYVADDKNGNTWAVTTNKPSYGEFQTYQPKDGGKTYYVQNLTETAAQYQAATGKAYGPLETAKAEAKYGASHNFSGLYVSPSQGYPGQGQGAPVNEAPVANGAGVVVGANEPAVSDGGIYAPQSNQTIYGGESSTENQGNINSEDNAVYENVSAMFEGHPNTVDNTGIPNDGNATFDTGAAFEGNVPNTHQSDNPVNVYGGQQYVSQKGGDYTENTSNIDASTVFEPSSPNVAQPQNPVSIKEQAVPSPQNVNVDGSVYLKEPVVDTSGMTSGNVPVGEQNLDGNVGGYTRRAPSNHDIGSKYKGRQRNNT